MDKLIFRKAFRTTANYTKEDNKMWANELKTVEEYWKRIEGWKKNICEFLKNKQFDLAENENDWFGWELMSPHKDFQEKDWQEYYKTKGWWVGVNDVLMSINNTSLCTIIDWGEQDE